MCLHPPRESWCRSSRSFASGRDSTSVVLTCQPFTSQIQTRWALRVLDRAPLRPLSLFLSHKPALFSYHHHPAKRSRVAASTRSRRCVAPSRKPSTRRCRTRSTRWRRTASSSARPSLIRCWTTGATHTHTAGFFLKKETVQVCRNKALTPPPPHFHSCRVTSSSNRRARCKSCLLTLLGFSVPLALMALLLLGSLSKELLELAMGREGMETLSLYLVGAFQPFIYFILFYFKSPVHLTK